MDLWDEWQNHYRSIGFNEEQAGRICKDGMIDEAAFAANNPRILFVLKETNGAPGLDLRAFLNNGPKFQMWHTVGRWAVGILQGFPDYNEITLECIQSGLSRVAIMNLKKLSGNAISNNSVVGAFALRDRILLRRQISELQPHYIVGCGTFEILMWLLELEIDPTKPFENVVQHRGTGAWVIPFRHPNRAGGIETYKKLRGALIKCTRSSLP